MTNTNIAPHVLTSTLTSLAVLRVNIDQRRDYLDYLRPFILQVLGDRNLESITDYTVAQAIEHQFGLSIPQRTVELVLRRLARSIAIQRDRGSYRITGQLPDPQLSVRQSEAREHTNRIVSTLIQFSSMSSHPIDDEQEAVEAVIAFLAEFDISCLRAYLRGTAIPALDGSHSTSVVLVSNFVQHIQHTNPDLFESFVVLVQGHMLANALLCPDLEHVTKDYSNVTFYLDTPMLVQALGLEGSAKEEAARDLIGLLIRLKGTVAAFEHSREELHGVIMGAAAYLDSATGRGSIVAEARKNGTTRSDLVVIAESIEEALNESGIALHRTPSYVAEFQIDENTFEDVLDDWIGYRNARAKIFDINSVRSIYAIRAKGRAPTIERAKAILVTSNHSVASAAWKYGQQYESSHDVSSVITDFTLANAAWLKAPLGAPNVPVSQLLSFSYAALQPSADLLDRYMSEIDRLEGIGAFEARDLEVLRSSPRVYPELMGYTLGDEAAVTHESISRTLGRISDQMTAEESARLHEEQEAHRATQEALTVEATRRKELVAGLHWRSQRNARVLSWGISITLAVIVVATLVVALLSEFEIIPLFATATWLILTVSGVLTVFACINLVLGLSVRGLHGWIQRRIYRSLLLAESKSIGIDIEQAMQ